MRGGKNALSVFENTRGWNGGKWLTDIGRWARSKPSPGGEGMRGRRSAEGGLKSARRAKYLSSNGGAATPALPRFILTLVGPELPLCPYFTAGRHLRFGVIYMDPLAVMLSDRLSVNPERFQGPSKKSLPILPPTRHCDLLASIPNLRKILAATSKSTLRSTLIGTFNAFINMFM